MSVHVCESMPCVWDWKDRHLCVWAEGICECVSEGPMWVSVCLWAVTQWAVAGSLAFTPCPVWGGSASPQAWLRLSEDPGTSEKAASQPLTVTQTGPLVSQKLASQGLPGA